MKKLCGVIDHQNKSKAYREALQAAGWHFTERELVQGLRFILTDADWRERTMANAAILQTPVFLYPHAARPMVQYDGCVSPKPVRCMFTHAEGGKAIMDKIGYPNPVEVAGWSYSEIRPFKPKDKIGLICFAPIHPNANGWLSDPDKDLNVHVSGLGDSAVTIEGFGWVRGSEYLGSKWYVLEEIKLRYDAAGVKIPFPQMDVHLDPS